MYHAIVRRKLRRVFEELSLGDSDYVLAGLSPRLEHSFAGTHALGGVRHSEAGMREWFGRLHRLFPTLRFTIKHIAVSGGPRDTTAVIEWHDSATTATGDRYDNDGVHVVRLRWGKLVSLMPIWIRRSWPMPAGGWPTQASPKRSPRRSWIEGSSGLIGTPRR